MKQKIVKKYIHQIKRIYRGKYSEKKQFTTELQDALLCFCEEHPGASYSDLVKEFGKPSEMKDILSFPSAEKLRKRNMFVYWSLNILIIAMIAVILYLTIRHVIDKHNLTQNGYYIEYFEDDTTINNINPLTGETDPPPDDHIDFD